MKKILFFISLAFLVLRAFSQEPQDSALSGTANSFKLSWERLYSMQDSPEREMLNDSILLAFKAVLNSPEGFLYPWEELNRIGKIKSEDGLVKVFTWHLEYSPNEFKYFGFIQKFDENKRNTDNVKLYSLLDSSLTIKNPELTLLSPSNWYGALYYGIKTFSFRKKVFYALLGFDFNNQYSRKRIIEVLSFEEDGTANFDAEIMVKDKVQHRYIIEYSSELTISMRYDKYLNMIVFDHVAPFQPILSGNPRFYGPDGSFDGFKFEEGRFMLVTDIDARNF